MARVLAFLGAGALLAVLLAGCGGSGSALPGPSDVFPTARIIEYVGDGHGGTKPFPPILQSMVEEVRTQAMGTMLKLGGVRKKEKVQRRLVNWAYVEPVADTDVVIVVTCQPWCVRDPGDPDLYVLDPYPDWPHGGHLGVYGYSDRLPSEPPNPVCCYAPDWVAFEPQRTDPYPAAQVAVYGYPPDVWSRFHLEADIVTALQVDGPTVTKVLGQRQSHWFMFDATGGTTYRVDVDCLKGDPDFYVYEGDSSHYLDGRAGPGGGFVPVTPSATGRCFIRVYAAPTGTTTKYAVRVREIS